MRDRYSIYEMIGKYVRFKLPKRLGDKTIEGFVDNVYRNVMEHKVEIIMGSKIYEFREPDSAELLETNVVVFKYGTPEITTDDQFFETHKNTAYQGGGVEAVFKELDKDNLQIRFKLLLGAPKRAHRRRKRKKR